MCDDDAVCLKKSQRLKVKRGRGRRWRENKRGWRWERKKKMRMDFDGLFHLSIRFFCVPKITNDSSCSHFLSPSFSPFLYHGSEEKREEERERERGSFSLQNWHLQQDVTTTRMLIECRSLLLQLNWWCQSLRKSFFFPLKKWAKERDDRKEKEEREREGGRRVEEEGNHKVSKVVSEKTEKEKIEDGKKRKWVSDPDSSFSSLFSSLFLPFLILVSMTWSLWLWHGMSECIE